MEVVKAKKQQRTNRTCNINNLMMKSQTALIPVFAGACTIYNPLTLAYDCEEALSTCRRLVVIGSDNIRPLPNFLPI